jgi:hypothetical protein
MRILRALLTEKKSSAISLLIVLINYSPDLEQLIDAHFGKMIGSGVAPELCNTCCVNIFQEMIHVTA